MALEISILVTTRKRNSISISNTGMSKEKLLLIFIIRIKYNVSTEHIPKFILKGSLVSSSQTTISGVHPVIVMGNNMHKEQLLILGQSHIRQYTK